ncbi:MAG: PilZ domain-containing protein [Myxococcota bacterium]|nr:PilZ domain-containing protein [Myxococcota bacterium]
MARQLASRSPSGKLGGWVKERRRFPRSDPPVVIREISEARGPFYSESLSAGGMRCITPLGPERLLGQVLALEMTFYDGRRSFVTAARIVRKKRVRLGMELALEFLMPQTQLCLSGDTVG